MHKHVHLTYHHVVPEGTKTLGMQTTTERLQSHITMLSEDGYIFLTLRDYADGMTTGDLPARVATLSFDDGLKDHIEHVLPILQENDIPGTFFIIAESAEGKLPWIMTWQWMKGHYGGEMLQREILPALFNEYPQFAMLCEDAHSGIGDLCKAQKPELQVPQAIMTRYVSSCLAGDLMRAHIESVLGPDGLQDLFESTLMTPGEIGVLSSYSNVEIASHTMSHPYLTVLGSDHLVGEFERSKRVLEDLTNDKVLTLGYPFGGSVPARVLEIAKAAGYLSAWNYEIPNMKIRTNSLYDICRIDQSKFE